MTRRKCPKCGSNSVAKILYGYMNISEELDKELKEKRTFLGGCNVSLINPKWFCNKCSFGWNGTLDKPRSCLGNKILY